LGARRRALVGFTDHRKLADPAVIAAAVGAALTIAVPSTRPWLGLNQ
jgi:hypothetical protein